MRGSKWRGCAGAAVAALIGAAALAALASVATQAAAAPKATTPTTVCTTGICPTTTTTEPPTTTTTTAPTTTTTVCTPSFCPTTTTTTAPPPRATTTTAPRSTTTTAPHATTTTRPRPARPPVRPLPRPAPAARGLTLSSPSAAPGATVVARGYGCTPGGPVALDLAGRISSTATADRAGDFDAPLLVTGLPAGRYPVVAHCGPTLATFVEVVLASKADPATSTLVVLVFFVLLGLGVVWHQAGM